MSGALDLHELTDGGQSAESIADRVVAYIEAVKQTLELALYDVRLPGEVGDRVADAIRGAQSRGVKVRLVYNEDHPHPIPVPPPPSTDSSILETLGVPMKPIPGDRDLMHHKYVIRDGRDVWTGSMNWTLDSWTRQENVIAVVTGDAGVARAYQHEFEELWRRTEVEGTGDFDAPRAQIRPWFCPGRGEDLSHRIAAAIGRSRRIRIASPVITASPILATLAQVVSDGRDVAGVVDGTQMHEVFGQWHENGNAAWKLPLIGRVLERGDFSGKQSTPYAPGATHDYMHAKVTVCDDVAFVGSFNLSHSGEQNAENVLEIHDAAVADRMASFIDAVRARYPKAPVPDGRAPRDGRIHR